MKTINFFKLTILFFLLLSNFSGFAQYTSIPDSNFEQALIDLNIDSGVIDGQVPTANIKTIKALNLQSKNISDLTGIEGFIQLEQLNIGILNNNPANSNKIKNLNISSNLNLNYLICTSNELTTLDLSKNINLSTLYIDSNKLTSIDISKNINLTTFSCRYNSLSSLDLTKNSALTNLDCAANQLSNLDVSKNTALLYLSLHNNQLSSLDISANNKLKNLSCGNNPISGLDLSTKFALEYLNFESTQITTIDVSKNTLLTSLEFRNNKIAALDISTNTKLVRLDATSNLLTNIDLSKNLFLDGILLNFNKLSDLDVSKNIALQSLDCALNNLSNLDVSTNSLLVSLDVNGNSLSNLDVSNNTKLISLSTNANKLISLDLSKNNNLMSFRCAGNQLTSLNLKNGTNKKLEFLDFKANSALSCIQVDDANYSNTNWSAAKDTGTDYSNDCNKVAAVAPPKIKASGDQKYCPQTTLNIVETFSITPDPLETGTQAGYIQISSGYSSDFDKLELSNPTLHSSVKTNWDPIAGKLTLTNAAGGNILYSDLEAAIKDVVFSNSSSTASGTRTFSITVGQANYLPSTGHYYLYVPSIGISWTSAKAAAETSNYYGLKGYLATLLSADEAKLSGEQASGTGWIGGSDQETEGVWKWVTGPEAGTVFWNGTANGSSPNFAFWNNSEPNQLGDEDYAHITQPGIGIRGSWNDLSNLGDVSGNYQPKGYVVEYGGSAGELPLEIAASTKITIPVATPDPNPAPICDSGSFNFTATATTGATISWYSQATGGTAIHTGPSYTTSILNSTTTYYVDAGCESNRKSVVATINQTPTAPVAVKSTYGNCGPGPVTIEASANIGQINWFAEATGGTSLHLGNSYTTPILSSNTTYYAEASNNNCIYGTRTPVNIEIYPLPVVTDETLPLCQGQTITLDTGIAGMTYSWSTGEATQTIPVNKGGTYTVVVTTPQDCSSTKTITVNENLVPQINHIDVNETTVTIKLVKEEDYFEYSVDGSNFQDSNVFYDVPGGLHNAYVKDKTGCPGGNSKSFVVLVFPAYFTPNNDTFHDVWEVTGIENYPQAQVTIFDRYGKLIAQLTASKMSWDGTFNKVALPASDYWYALKIDDTQPVLRGHFSLKR